jgi:anti-sigma regulatory factor (Ser/Thr protein kinase)
MTGNGGKSLYPGQAQPDPADGVTRTELPAILTSARQARAAVRQVLAAWGMSDPDGDAELLTSELVANASEHGKGPISLALRRHVGQGGRTGITCEVTDASPDLPRHCQPGPDAERGRGRAIVSALASASGVRASDSGKTTWFTLALHDSAAALTRPVSERHEPAASGSGWIEPELEAGL